MRLTVNSEGKLYEITKQWYILNYLKHKWYMLYIKFQ